MGSDGLRWGTLSGAARSGLAGVVNGVVGMRADAVGRNDLGYFYHGVAVHPRSK